MSIFANIILIAFFAFALVYPPISLAFMFRKVTKSQNKISPIWCILPGFHLYVVRKSLYYEAPLFFVLGCATYFIFILSAIVFGLQIKSAPIVLITIILLTLLVLVTLVVNIYMAIDLYRMFSFGILTFITLLLIPWAGYVMLAFSVPAKYREIEQESDKAGGGNNATNTGYFN